MWGERIGKQRDRKAKRHRESKRESVNIYFSQKSWLHSIFIFFFLIFQVICSILCHFHWMRFWYEKKGSKLTLSQFNRNYLSLCSEKSSNRQIFEHHSNSIFFTFFPFLFLFEHLYVVKKWKKQFFLFIFLADRQYFRTNRPNKWK